VVVKSYFKVISQHLLTEVTDKKNHLETTVKRGRFRIYLFPQYQPLKILQDHCTKSMETNKQTLQLSVKRNSEEEMYRIQHADHLC
jgi:2-C-methyl-D-erythritol 4-phosphate cytidylyltransferase